MTIYIGVNDSYFNRYPIGKVHGPHAFHPEITAK